MDFSKVDSRIIALGFARMADAVANSFLIVVLPIYIASGQITGGFFGFTEAAITGIILGSFGIVNSIVQPMAGKLSDQLGKRKLFIFSGLMLIAAINISYLLVDNYIGILIIRILQAGSAALTIVGSVALVSELSPHEGRGQNMGVYNSFRLVGFGSGPLVAGALITGGPYALFGGLELTGFELSFYGAGIAAFISAMLVAFLVSDPDNIKS
ncbi:MAG TPA: MFS transporter, partial [Fodinibius sp.]|nr:MFS transporter [Fodinibius sp.]